MDKNTLSNYGWIVTCVLVLAVMIALSTPFGTYIKDAVWSTTEGLFDVSENALGVLGIDLVDDTADDIGTVGSDKTITLRGSKVADGTYTLKYENNGTPLTGYADICSLAITDGADASYTSLIAENCAPVGATVIGVYDSADARVGEISLGSLKTNLGTKLYSFGAISDVHIGNNTASSDFQNALTYFENETDIEFIANCGDMATSGSDANLNTYKSIASTYTTKPIYEVTGNHEANRGYLTMDEMHPFTGEDLYYSFTKGNDVYIMVGMYDVHAGVEFSVDELNWLYETLEANKDKRCFLFMHLNPRDGSGDAIDLDLAGDMLNNTYGDVFYSLVSHYNNVIWFHGHTHQTFDIQAVNEMNNYDNKLGSHSVHIPSLSTPRNTNGSSLYDLPNESEGYVVDVYENNIVLKGRDFITGEFLPIASYCLNTSTKNVVANTYYDSTQTVVNSNSNILKSGGTWYEGSVDKSTITKVAFANNYSSTYDESWDASISGNNQVMAYRKGTEITIVGNKNGIIANINSSGMFKDFTGLTEITGFENLNTSNVGSATSPIYAFTNVFENCKKLKSVDISSLNLRYVTRMNAMFKGCSNLTSVKLPANIGKDANDVNGGYLYILQSMFEDCTSLTYVDVSMLLNKNANISNMFKDTSSLEEVKFGALKVVAAANLFYRDSSLTKVDMSNVDFSPCDTMLQMFQDCSSLSLDCSGWDVSKVTSYKNFNSGAPNVIAPAFN